MSKPLGTLEKLGTVVVAAMLFAASLTVPARAQAPAGDATAMSCQYQFELGKAALDLEFDTWWKAAGYGLMLFAAEMKYRACMMEAQPAQYTPQPTD